MSIRQQIEELPAELKGCTDAAEIAMIRRELDAAVEHKSALDLGAGSSVSGARLMVN